MTTAPFASNVRPMRARGTARVRPFVEADIPQVVDVHRAAFGLPDHTSSGEHAEYFTRVFLDGADRDITSLVFQDHDGRIAGFVGVVPRRVTINGRAQRNIQPSASTLLEDVRTRGDRQHPFWAKVENK